MEQLKVNQVAQELGVTPAGVYKRLKTDFQLIENYIVKEKNTTFITREGVEILRKLMQKTVSNGNSTSYQSVDSQAVKYLQEFVGNQQKTINDLIAKQSEERQRTDTIIMKLAHDIGNLQKVLEEKQQLDIPEKSLQIFKPWEPRAKKKPELPKLKKLWYELTNPVRLRAN